MSDFNRTNYTKLILERLGLNRSAFFYVRGRRRVGKSWILKKISKSLPHTFYYMGAQDLTDSNSISNFIAEWESFSKIVRLSNLKPALLSWKVVFDEITSYVQNNKKNTVLIFAEIQWIAKEGSGLA
jgi:AAA+ ATPase superfamily predicted ATPase